MIDSIWIQAFLPFSIALFGILILYWDSANQKLDLNNVLRSVRHSYGSQKIETEYSKLRNKAIGVLQVADDNRLIQERLNKLGFENSNELGDFRYRQIAISAGISIIPFIALFLIQISLLAAISLSPIFGIATFYVYDHLLTLKVRNRRMQIEYEFPALIEMLTLSIAAGETPIAALSRICHRSNSLLSREFVTVLKAVQVGKPFHEALDQLGRNLQSPSIRRFVDALVLAMVRGAPIVEVLHRHVAEARINHRNLVMDKAGRAETLMMVPVVFLILPISVLFALWPSINQLSLFTS